MLEYFRNVYLREIMVLFGVPESVFNHADPLYVFFVFMFSSEIFIFFFIIIVVRLSS